MLGPTTREVQDHETLELMSWPITKKSWEDPEGRMHNVNSWLARAVKAFEGHAMYYAEISKSDRRKRQDAIRAEGANYFSIPEDDRVHLFATEAMEEDVELVRDADRARRLRAAPSDQIGRKRKRQPGLLSPGEGVRIPGAFPFPFLLAGAGPLSMPRLLSDP